MACKHDLKKKHAPPNPHLVLQQAFHLARKQDGAPAVGEGEGRQD